MRSSTTPPLFDFRLRPLQEITPWHGPEGPSLGWFGLTDGAYWVIVASQQLADHLGSDNILSPSSPCEYQVARLFDDVTELAPYALTEVPPRVDAFLRGTTGQAWRDYHEAWWHLPDDLPQTEELDRLRSAAWEPMRLRMLSTSYLRPCIEILMWSFDGAIHIKWENREIVAEGVPVRGALRGGALLTRERFIDEIEDFSTRLCDAMEARVHQVRQGVLGPHVRVDIDSLVREQGMRRQQLAHELANPRYMEDWAAVAAAIEKLDSLRRGRQPG